MSEAEPTNKEFREERLSYHPPDANTVHLVCCQNPIPASTVCLSISFMIPLSKAFIKHSTYKIYDKGAVTVAGTPHAADIISRDLSIEA